MATTPTKTMEMAEDQETKEFQVFLHHLSPIQQGNRFSFDLQGRKRTHRVTCFTPSKRALFENKENSPMKISNYSKSYRSQDLILGKDSIVQDLKQLDFECTDLSVMKINKIQQRAVGGLVDITGEVKKVEDTRTVKDGALTMQTIFISDETACIKVVLWEEFVRKVESRKTYKFNQMRINMERNGSIYLNTAKVGSSIEETSPIDNTLDGEAMEESWIKGEIMSVDRVQKYLMCMKCNKKIDSPDCKTNIVICSNIDCKKKMKVKGCTTNIYAKLMFQNVEGKIINITMFKEMILMLMPSAESTSESQIEEALLEIPVFQVVLSSENIVRAIKMDEN